jgi:hypothetical protein
MDKFKKYNVLLLITNSRENKDYINFKKEFNDNIKEFHKYGILLKKYVTTKEIFKIILFSRQKKIYESEKYINPNKLLSKYKNKLEKANLSLYSDYHPTTSKKGLGYKNKKVALDTINKIKNNEVTYQKIVIQTLLNRAKFHPNRTLDMEDAIKVFEKYLKSL